MADQCNQPETRTLTESEWWETVREVFRSGRSAVQCKIVQPEAHVIRALERKAATMPQDHVVDPSIKIPQGNIVAVWEETVFVMRPHEGVIELDLSEIHFLIDPASLTPEQARVLRLEVARG